MELISVGRKFSNKFLIVLLRSKDVSQVVRFIFNWILCLRGLFEFAVKKKCFRAFIPIVLFFSLKNLNVNGAPSVQDIVSKFEAKIKAAIPASPAEVETPQVPVSRPPLDPSELPLQSKVKSKLS